MKKTNEIIVFCNLKDNIKIRKQKFNLREFVRRTDIKRVFTKGYSTNWSDKLNTKTEVIHDTIPRSPIDYLPERNNENFLGPKNYTWMKKIKL